ncbi:MAG: OmpH family outer membrane protein [Bacteroidales bacterium]|nr:OmpH family outer membrane protein [Bacteroidales bacterium]
MKKIALLLFVSCFVVLSSLNAQTRLKIGHIDSSELLLLMPERDSARTKLEAHARQLESQLTAMSSEFESKYQDFAAQQATMSELIKQTKTRELQELQSRIESFQQSAQEELETKEAELLNPILSKAKQAIEDVAKENGFTYILDVSSGALLYFEGENILPLVKRKLGL